MGWFSEDAPEHEGYTAYLLQDGRRAGAYTGRGLLPDPTMESADAVPWSQLVGWQTACTCGWTGRIWLRSEVTAGGDVHGEVHHPDEAYLSDTPSDTFSGARAGEGDTTLEDLAHEDWSAHMVPLGRAAAIREAAAAAAAARSRLDQAVQAARSDPDPLSWTEIGHAAGITRQAAHERWGRIVTALQADQAAGKRLCAHADRNGQGMHWLMPGEVCPDASPRGLNRG